MKIETKIFGHRGYPAKFAENSLEGFEYALENGADGIEFDVHLTKDQVPVVMHDEKINRTTDGKGNIKDYTHEELQQFHLENGETIPVSKRSKYASNWELSSARAVTVMRYFVSKGAISESNVSVQAYAENKPKDSNDTDEGKAKNRRVEIIIQKINS